MPIYTKTGDKGETSLFGGKRISKSHSRVSAYGSLDELNSWVGLLVARIDIQEKKDLLLKIQADLHVMAAVLAGWQTDLSPLKTRVTEMEVEIDTMEGTLPTLTNFILPGGTETAAYIHIVRTMTRKIERELVLEFSKEQQTASNKRQVNESEIILQYVNRLSDLFFVLARFINKEQNVPDIVWSGIERKK